MPVGESESEQLLLSLVALLRQLKSLPILRAEPGPGVFLLRPLEQPKRVSDLAHCVGLDASTVSRHLKAFEDQGLVTRTEDPADRRASLVQITPAGRHLLAEVSQAWAVAVGNATADWSVRDSAALITLMTRLAESMERTPLETENG